MKKFKLMLRGKVVKEFTIKPSNVNVVDDNDGSMQTAGLKGNELILFAVCSYLKIFYLDNNPYQGW